MCGIAGFCNMPKNWRDNIAKMNCRMIHRGPDSEGIWASENADVVIGHRRLSILDLSPAGAQPMLSASGRFVIALNGEIYNYKEIQEKLLRENKVQALRGTSDTEVLLEACEAYGLENALKLSKGMFAVALYDRKTRELFLARDRMGEKPLYYGFLKNGFIFASDIAAIQENLEFEAEMDLDALTLYFDYGYIPAPYTIYKSVKKLEAGSILKISAPFCEPVIYKYWDIMQIAQSGQENLFPNTREEAADELERLLRSSIQLQMIADVPVGAFLSGGIDSTTVVAIMQSLSKNRVKTFTIGFAEQEYNEAGYAKQTAQYLGTDHTELYISNKEAQAVIPKLAHVYGEPFADSSQIPTYLVSMLAKESVTVSLSGDGGDELFAGYNSYPAIERAWGRIKAIPYPLRKKVAEAMQKFIKAPYVKKRAVYLAAKNAENLYALTGAFQGKWEGLVCGGKIPDYKYNEYPSNYLKGITNNIMLMDMLMYHPDDILVKVDRAGMAVSLESRIPLLDRDIVEYAWKLPAAYKRSGGVGKRVLKDVLYRYVPKDMVERPKTGFSIPIEQWIREGDLRKWAEDMLSQEHIKRQGILDAKRVGEIWKQFMQSGENGRLIWYLLMFEEWYQLTKEVIGR